MNIDVITSDDLETFRQLLLSDLKKLLSETSGPKPEWLRSSDVRKLLSISAGTLQNLRVNGKLKFKKVGSIHFYLYSDLEKMLTKGG